MSGPYRGAVIAARGSFAMIAVWIVLDMLLHAADLRVAHAIVDLPFALVCHRLPERVLTILDVPMPLCSRCVGLFGGLSIAAAIGWPALPLRVLRVVIPVAAGLLLVELLTQDLGLHPVFHPTRLLSGLLLSVPVGGAIGRTITRDLSGPRA